MAVLGINGSERRAFNGDAPDGSPLASSELRENALAADARQLDGTRFKPWRMVEPSCPEKLAL